MVLEAVRREAETMESALAHHIFPLPSFLCTRLRMRSESIKEQVRNSQG